MDPSQNNISENIKIANEKLFSTKKQNGVPLEGIVFVYTPPKVGSTTLVSSLRISMSSKYTIIHIHDEIMLERLTGIQNVTINDLIKYNASLGKKVYVIDIYRTPIERKMSEYFEKLSAYHFNNKDENLINYNMNLIIHRFNNIFPYLENGDHYMDKYDVQPKLPFDHTKKHIIQDVDNITYIKLRLVDSDEWSSILTNIFGTQIVIVNEYKTENKPIGELFSRFKNQYKLPRNFLNEIKKDKNLHHFFTFEEVYEYIYMWNEKISESVTPYTESEYKLYMEISLENCHEDMVQFDHYIDNGCICSLCKTKREIMFSKAVKGEKITERINHREIINEIIKDNLKDKIIKKRVTNIVTNDVNKQLAGLSVNLNKKKTKFSDLGRIM
jgi:hypothetical protein